MTARDTIAYRGRSNIYLNLTNRCSCDCDFCFRGFTSEVFGSDLTTLVRARLRDRHP